MKKIIWSLQILFFAIGLSKCKSVNTVGKEYISQERNSYKFDSQIDSIMNKDPKNPDYEWAATLYSLKSNFKQALSIWDSIPENPNRSKAIDTNFIQSGYRVLSAKNYIIKESKKSSLIILNEAHHNNSHRVFAESLLPGLYKNGYKMLFLETLINNEEVDTLLNKRKYPIDGSGFYSINPQYGNFIRKALKIGFTIFPYETTRNIDGKIREIKQANNIYSILKKHPDKKALIYVGYGHNREGKVSYWDKTMAERLKELTGIDPITISQDKFSEKSSKSLSNPLLVELNLKEPSILLNKENSPYKTKTDSSWIDITVFHPFTEYKNGRPNWLFFDNKKSVSIDFKEITIDFPILLMAYNNKKEIKNKAIPLDIVEVDNKDEYATLVLKKGKFTLKVINEYNIYQLIDIIVY
ncbi:MAG: hypothetical protein WBA61_02900 [Aequorivita sp.]